MISGFVSHSLSCGIVRQKSDKVVKIYIWGLPSASSSKRLWTDCLPSALSLSACIKCTPSFIISSAGEVPTTPRLFPFPIVDHRGFHISGSAGPGRIDIPFFLSGFSLSNTPLATSVAVIRNPMLGVSPPLEPYHSQYLNNIPLGSTAHHPTLKGVAYPQSIVRYRGHSGGMSNGSMPCTSILSSGIA